MDYIDPYDLGGDEYDFNHEGAISFDGPDIGIDFEISSSPEIEISDDEAEGTDSADDDEAEGTDSTDDDEAEETDSADDGETNSSRSSSPSDSIELPSSPPPPRRYLHDPYDELDEDDADSINFVLSSPPAERAASAEEDEILFVDEYEYEEEEEEQEEEEEVDDHPFASSAVLRGQIDLWQQQHQNLVESRRQITETLREITEQQRTHNQIPSRFWQDTLGDRRNAMPTAPSTTRQPPSRPTRPRDTDSGQPRRSDRRRNSGQQANPNPLDQLFAVEVEAPRRQNSSQRRTEGAGGARTASRSVPVIDLTGEPDSPAVPRNTLTLPRPGVPPMSMSGSSHPRRQMPTNNQPPALNRRDVVSNVVIDLTGDDDAPSARTARQGARPPRPPGHAANPAHVQPVDLEAEEHRAGPHQIFGVLGQLRRFILPNATGFGVGGLEFVIHNPLGNNRPDFNYQANGYNNGGRGEASNKPVHVPPPKAREGFTRNTSNGSSGGSDELDVLVCPACEKELAYDPDEEGGTSTPGKGGPAPKKARTKKDREEHHFWALKECGHVFCKNCYDTRTKRAATKTSEKSKFRIEPAPSKKILCVVDDCTTEVNKPAAWVGLFL